MPIEHARALFSSRRWSRRLIMWGVAAAVPVAGVVLATGAESSTTFTATASVQPAYQYLNDTAGTVFTFTVNNTGTVSIGAVEIDRPSNQWTIIGCPTAPAGWSAQAADTKCRYRSDSTTSDDIQGHTSATFALRATTLPGTSDRKGSWSVIVSKVNNFDTKSLLTAAKATDTGLATTAYTWEITDAVVADTTSAAGTACPTASKQAITGSTNKVIVICGFNHASTALTPVGTKSSLGGTFVVAGTGSFVSGSIPANSDNVVLADWTGVTITSSFGPDKTVVATIGCGTSRVPQTSPSTTLTGYEALNRPPVAVDDTATTDEDHTVSVAVLGNDSDPDGDAISVTSYDAAGSTGGTITQSGSELVFDPGSDFNSLAVGESRDSTFGYTISDVHGATATATVTVTVTGVNDAPSAVDDTATTDQNTPVTIHVRANDTDPDASDTLSIVSLGVGATKGLVESDGSDVFYAPNGQFNYLQVGQTAVDSFAYTISDGHGGTSTATATVTVSGLNDQPTAVADAASVSENTTTTVSVLSNDTDPDSGDTLSVQSVDTSGTKGIAAVADGGSDVSYDPNGQFDYLSPGQSATDSFSYTVSDGHGGTATTVVSMTINGVDNAPVVSDTTASANEDDVAAPVTLIANDPDGPTPTFNVLSGPDHGTLSCTTDCGSALTYAPAPNYNGPDSFTYSANDGTLSSGTATVTITVAAVNDGPSFTKGTDQQAVVSSGPQTVDGWATNISAGPADESGQILTFHVAADDTSLFSAQPAIDASTGDLTFTPGALPGSTTVHVTLSDDGGTANGGVDTSPAQTFTITLVPPNTAPTADNLTPSTNEDTAKVVTLSSDDADGDALTFHYNQPTHGAVTTSNSPSCTGATPNHCTLDVTYTPAANYNGADSFTYTTNDGTVDSNTATVSLTVVSVNDAPSFTAGGDQTVLEDAGAQTVPGWASNISAGPADESAQALTFHVTSDNDAMFSTGPAVDTSNGDLTYQSAPNANGVAHVSVYLTDNGGTTNGGSDTSPTQSFTITVTAVNDPPVATDDTGATNEDSSVNVPVLTNDTDVDGDTLSVNAVDTTGTTGSVTINGDGTIKYDAAGHFDSLTQGQQVTDTFTYTASDGNGGVSNSATVTVTITGINDAPVAHNDSFSTAQANTLFTVGTTGTGPHVSTTGNVLSNDTDVDTPSTSFTATAVTPTASGADVTMNSDGTFSYVPPAGFVGSDTFSYTVHDNDSTNPKTSTGTVTIVVQGPLVWYVDNSLASAGDGRSTSPFNSLAPLTTGGSADSKDGSGDIIFVYQGSGSYTGGIVLEANQQLVGQPQGLLVNGNQLVVAAGSNPAVVNASGDAITLANGAQVQRVDVAVGSSGAAVKGASVSTATIGANTTLNGGTGGGLVLSGAASGNISVGSTITTSSGHSVAISNRAGGTVSLSGAVTDTGSGISLTTNTGATVSLTGQLSLTTTTNTGFAATSGGTVVATASTNAVTTTTGVAVDIANTTIGASGVTFRSVTAGTAGGGPANGIVLNNTGVSGSFSVTGTGTASSGGVIQDTVSHAVSLTATTGPSFNDMSIQNASHAGIKGTQVHGFTLTNSTVTGFGAAHTDVKDAAVAFNDAASPQDNIDGAVTITGDTISNGYGSAVDIINYAGTISDANISSNTLTSSTSTSTSKGDAIALNLFGTTGGVASLTKAEISANAISNFPSGNGIVVQGGNTASAGAPAGNYGTPVTTPGTGTNIVTISANSIAGDATTRMAAAGISASVNGKGSGNFNIINNGASGAPIRNMIGQGIGAGVSGSATANFNISGNFVAPHNALGSVGIGVGSDVNIQADSSTLTTPTINAIVSNNAVSNTDGYGIQVEQRDSNGTSNVKVMNNNVSTPTSQSEVSSINVAVGSTGNATYNPQTCATISGNTAATGPDDGAGNQPPGIILDKLVAGSTTYKFGITGLTASPATVTQTENYVAGVNSSGAGSGFWGSGTVFAGNDGFTACTLAF